jgi:AcrR family transcriptional regulator
MPQKPALRAPRQPKQARGRRQVDNILDAAAALFASSGYDATSTNAIAEQAHTSIGSLYQFFPNKAAIYEALTLRYVGQFRDVLDRVVTLEVAHLPLALLIDRVVDAFWEVAHSQQGVTKMLLSAQLSPELAEHDNALVAASVQRIDAILAARAPELSADRRALIATIAVDVVHALLQRASVAPPAMGALIIAEGKALLRAYLAAAIEDAAPAHR